AIAKSACAMSKSTTSTRRFAGSIAARTIASRWQSNEEQSIMIKSGRYGEVWWDPTGATTYVKLLSINKWKADFKTDKIDVTCFGDANKVYVPGMKDVSGDFSGFYNSADLTIFEAADQDTPGAL